MASDLETCQLCFNKYDINVRVPMQLNECKSFACFISKIKVDFNFIKVTQFFISLGLHTFCLDCLNKYIIKRQKKMMNLI